MTDIEEMRKSWEATKVYRKGVAKDGAEAHFCEAYNILGRWYAQVGTIAMSPEEQWVKCVDITDEWNDVALFSGSWPSYSERKDWRYCYIIIPDEGHSALLMENGYERWISFVEIKLQVLPFGAPVGQHWVERDDE